MSVVWETSVKLISKHIGDVIVFWWDMISPKVGGPLSVMKVLGSATSTSKENHTIYSVAS